MRINEFKLELSLGLVVVVLLILLINPFSFLMLDMTTMFTLGLFAAAILSFGTLVWKERSVDERESAHRQAVGHWSYLTGAGILALGIIVEAARHSLDPWLPIALGAMVLAKIVARVYYEKEK